MRLKQSRIYLNPGWQVYKCVCYKWPGLRRQNDLGCGGGAGVRLAAKHLSLLQTLPWCCSSQKQQHHKQQRHHQHYNQHQHKNNASVTSNISLHLCSQFGRSGCKWYFQLKHTSLSSLATSRPESHNFKVAVPALENQPTNFVQPHVCYTAPGSFVTLLHCYTVTLCYTAPGSYYRQSSKLELVREGVKQRRYVKHLNVRFSSWRSRTNKT